MENFNEQNQNNQQQGYQQQGYQQQGYQQQGYQQQGYQQQGYQQQGYQQQGMPNQTPPPANNMVGAILVTILCCLPFGIAAIVNASRVESLWYAGNQQAAIDAAEKARKWVIAAIVSSLVFGALYFIFLLACGVAAEMF